MLTHECSMRDSRTACLHAVVKFSAGVRKPGCTHTATGNRLGFMNGGPKLGLEPCVYSYIEHDEHGREDGWWGAREYVVICVWIAIQVSSLGGDNGRNHPVFSPSDSQLIWQLQIGCWLKP